MPSVSDCISDMLFSALAQHLAAIVAKYCSDVILTSAACRKKYIVMEIYLSDSNACCIIIFSENLHPVA